jgi:NAD(P)-dependent dehydrogenase (short-subunit alcohol dehydrogenase family)
MNLDFQDKKVLVTGASRGIGRATAIAFAEAGARVAVHFFRSQKRAEQVQASLAGSGHLTVQADVANPQAVERLVTRVVEQFGRIDVLVNNAAVSHRHSLDSTSYQDWQSVWQQTISTNLFGPANVTYQVARHMIEHRSGRIVMVSSRGAFRGEPSNPAYGASKSGLNSLGQSLAQHLAPYNILVMTVAPGFVERVQEILNTSDARQQSPLNRVALPEEVASTILFLASEGAEFLTGSIVDVNGASYLR